MTLIGKPGCHLCDEAREVVARVTAELGESFTELSTPTTPTCTLATGSRSRSPSSTASPHDFWRVSEDRLRAALTTLTLKFHFVLEFTSAYAGPRPVTPDGDQPAQ